MKTSHINRMEVADHIAESSDSVAAKQCKQLLDNRDETKAIKQLQTNLGQQPMTENTCQRQAEQTNNTGLPQQLKTGMESISGVSLDNVKVHYNSSLPQTVQAHAFAQGTDIHLAAGQERHLPHELGHVVQQAQGRVTATTSINGMAVNDSPHLEAEATQLGEAALHHG